MIKFMWRLAKNTANGPQCLPESNNKRGLRKDMDKLNQKIHTRRKN